MSGFTLTPNGEPPTVDSGRRLNSFHTFKDVNHASLRPDNANSKPHPF
jgi:hypothetical protein